MQFQKKVLQKCKIIGEKSNTKLSLEDMVSCRERGCAMIVGKNVLLCYTVDGIERQIGI